MGKLLLCMSQQNCHRIPCFHDYVKFLPGIVPVNAAVHDGKIGILPHNLYSKGACYSICGKLGLREAKEGYIFLRQTPYPSLSHETVSWKPSVRSLSTGSSNSPFPVFLSKPHGLPSVPRRLNSVYLIGDGYRDGWADESLHYLCRGRRVFQGNNLYSKGACYGMMERLHPGEEWKEHVYLGDDKLSG